MKNAYWSVVPSITWWRGDPRRNRAPYYIGDGMGYTALNVAQWVARELRRRGIACHVELIEE